jgi:putative ABC transport system permease protein
MTLAGLAVKNIRRNRLRTILTVVGVATAILAFVFLRTGVAAWANASEYAAKDRLTTFHRVTFIMPVPKRYFSYFDGTRGQFDGIRAATFANWFGARHPIRKNEFFQNLAVDTDTFFGVYADMSVPPGQLQAWKDNRRGAIIGDALAQQFDWDVGDVVTLEGTIYPGEWQFEISGIYTATERSIDRTQFLFHWDYLNESIPEDRREEIGWIISAVDDPSKSPDIIAAVDAVFDEMDIQTRTMTEKAMQMEFLAGFGALFTALDVVSVVILFIMMLILGNTIAMGVRERTNEYGVLLALGFRPRHIAGFVVGEALTVGMLGGVLGLALGYPLIEYGMGRWLEENMGSFFPYFRIPTDVVVMALLISAALAMFASIIPALRASRLNVIEALRRLG